MSYPTIPREGATPDEWSAFYDAWYEAALKEVGVTKAVSPLTLPVNDND